MHALLRPAEGWAGAGLRQGVPHRFDPVRRAAGAACPRRGAHRQPAPPGCHRRLPLRCAWDAGRDRRSRPPPRLFPVDRSAGGLQPPRRAEPRRRPCRAEPHRRPCHGRRACARCDRFPRHGRKREGALMAHTADRLMVWPRRPDLAPPAALARRSEQPAPAVPRRDGEIDTYYGRPALKPSPFGWMVALYIFEGGLAGAAQMIATIADSLGPPEARPLVRRGRYIAVGGAAAGAALLVADLHTPERFLNMLRIFRATSPMSIGTYILSSFGAFSALAALGQLVDDIGGSGVRAWPRRLARIAQFPAALAGAGMTSYTAALLSSPSTPLWAAEPQLLAIRFASS